MTKTHRGNMLFIVEKTLTDGSKVFNVLLGEREFPAVTYDDAHSMSKKIAAAINDHSTVHADVIDET